MLSEEYLHRFGGVVRLYGTQKVTALNQSHVLVIGIGGVGSWVAEALARSGVGNLSLMDLDDICISNTNRQVHTVASTIGFEKVAVMKTRLQAINPEISVTGLTDFLNKENISEYIQSQYSVIVDAIDNAAVKTALIAYCQRQKIPLITVGSAGGKKDPTKITSADLSRTTQDPLLAKVRNNLRRLHNFTRNPKRRFGIEAIYSTEAMTYPDNQGETCQTKAFMSGGDNLDCGGGYGAATMVTASFGFLAASRVIEKIS